MTKKPVIQTTTVRLPADLYHELAELANAEERSLNTTMVRALRVYVEANR